MRLIPMMIASFLCAGSALAQTPQMTAATPTVSWSCWYAAEYESSIACRLSSAPESVSGGAATSNMVHRIRYDPGSLQDEVVLIPIGGPPVDTARTARLARAVMCGSRNACSVEYSQPSITR